MTGQARIVRTVRYLTAICFVVLLVACSSDNTGTATTDAGDAPDFELELGNGGTFLLAEEARPVYLVFWAEW